MSGPIAAYYASVGISVDKKSLREVDAYLEKLEKRLKQAAGVGQSGKSGAKAGHHLKVNLWVDTKAFHQHLSQVFDRVSSTKTFEIKRFKVDQAKIITSTQTALDGKTFRVGVTGYLLRSSIAMMRAQIVAGLQGIPVSIGGVSRRGGRAASSGGGNAPSYGGGALHSKGVPSWAERLMGKPDKNSLSAANRRYFDAEFASGTAGFLGNGKLGKVAQVGMQGLGRLATGSMFGRIATLAGGALGGPVGSVIGASLSLIPSALGSMLSASFKMITVPFRLLGSAVSMATSAILRLGAASAAIAFGFNALSNRVIQSQQTGIALDTVATKFGSSGATESRWLMDMANRDGMAYRDLVDPFTAFLGAAAPVMGGARAKGIFEAFAQYGATHGATGESSQKAFLALSQMAGKGQVMSEELKNQLAEAKGFSGMMGIFAEAWQRVQGREGDSIKRGEAAHKELLKAMEDGKVTTAKILPYVEEIAKKQASRGIDQARESAFAEKNRFLNQITAGWQNFAQAGGSNAVSMWWQAFQIIGRWWEDNGSEIGQRFLNFTIWINHMVNQVRDLFATILTGNVNDTSEKLREWGIDVLQIRELFIKAKDAVTALWNGIETVLGITNRTDMGVVQSRFVGWTQGLINLFMSITEVIRGIGLILQGNIAEGISVAAKGTWNTFGSSNDMIKAAAYGSEIAPRYGLHGFGSQQAYENIQRARETMSLRTDYDPYYRPSNRPPLADNLPGRTLSVDDVKFMQSMLPQNSPADRAYQSPSLRQDININVTGNITGIDPANTDIAEHIKVAVTEVVPSIIRVEDQRKYKAASVNTPQTGR